jgi:cyanophycinase
MGRLFSAVRFTCMWVWMGTLFVILGCGNDTNQRLVLGGGGNIPSAALDKFLDWSGGPEANLLIVTWSTEFPDDSYEYYRHRFHPAHVTESVRAQNIAASVDTFLLQLKSATGVFFTGGDQNRVFDILENHNEIRDAFRAAYFGGVTMGGTSAGTAIMSLAALTGEVSGMEPLQVGLRTGLGFMENAVLDQHFLERKRLPRLVAALRQTQLPLGIGVDESAAFTIENNRIGTVVGSQKVVLVHNSNYGAEQTLTELNPGQKYDLIAGKPIQ